MMKNGNIISSVLLLVIVILLCLDIKISYDAKTNDNYIEGTYTISENNNSEFSTIIFFVDGSCYYEYSNDSRSIIGNTGKYSYSKCTNNILVISSTSSGYLFTISDDKTEIIGPDGYTYILDSE